jgi:hypothetical protein
MTRTAPGSFGIGDTPGMRGLRPGRNYREQAVAPDAIAGVEACGAQPIEMALDGMVMVVVPGMREHALDLFVV